MRWWGLRCEIEPRGGGDVVTSLTTSGDEIAPQSPPARGVAGGEPASASSPLLDDVTASPTSRLLASAASAPATHGRNNRYTPLVPPCPLDTARCPAPRT